MKRAGLWVSLGVLSLPGDLIPLVSSVQLSMELKQNLKNTMTQKYRKEGEESVTSAVDKLQQEVGIPGAGENCRASNQIHKKRCELLVPSIQAAAPA